MRSAFLLLLVFLSCSFLCHAKPGRDITSFLSLDNGLDWGKWGTFEFCPEGSYAQDIEIRFESYELLDADETAVNSVKLYCVNKESHLTRYITSTIGKKGKWKGMKTCPTGMPTGMMTGMRAKVLRDRGLLEDDVAVQNVEMECDFGLSTVLAMDEDVANIPDGCWSTWSKCDGESAICGIQIRYDKEIILEDDVALSDMVMACCSLLRNNSTSSSDVTR